MKTIFTIGFTKKTAEEFFTLLDKCQDTYSKDLGVH